MTAPPMVSPALTKTDKHAKPIDGRGKDSGVPQSRVLRVCSALPGSLLYPTAYFECVPRLLGSAVHPSERGFLKSRIDFLATDSSRGPGVAACAGSCALKPPVSVPAAIPASPLTFLYGLCRKALSVPFDDPLSVHDATGVANIDAIRGCKSFLVPV